MKKILELRNLTKEYHGNVVLKGIDLDIFENEFVTFLGPSGCGKTTTLKIIGGFETQSDGTVFMEGIDLKNVPAHKRNLNTVFQRYALFPHFDVFENIAFGLRIKKMDKALIQEKVSKILKVVNLVGYEQRNIDQLSGGQMQRVAIARALVMEPKILLLDEPLAALDLKLRQEMQYELKEIQRNMGITFIYVTHDQEEALTMSDKIVVMDQGAIQQIGTPVDIYNEPINRFVAKFIGESNIIPGIMLQDYLVEFDGKKFECVDKGFRTNQEIEVVIRPEDIDIVSEECGKIHGVVDSIAFKGVHYEIDVVTSDRVYTIHSTDLVKLNQKVGLTFNPEDLHIMEVTNFD